MPRVTESPRHRHERMKVPGGRLDREQYAHCLASPFDIRHRMVSARYSMSMAMSRAANAEAQRQLGAADWVRAATDAIVAGGIGAVAVEPLAARLGTTKGSFYHHFPNRDALIVAMLEEWERSETEAVIARLELLPDPGERLRAVMASALADQPGGVRDAALLGAATHPLVKPVVARVTERRLTYIAQAYSQLGLSDDEARRRALLFYSSYLGLFDYLRVGLGRRFAGAELQAYTEEVLAALVPA
jgi:AcrR family transcriptional regulator